MDSQIPSFGYFDRAYARFSRAFLADLTNFWPKLGNPLGRFLGTVPLERIPVCRVLHISDRAYAPLARTFLVVLTNFFPKLRRPLGRFLGPVPLERTPICRGLSIYSRAYPRRSTTFLADFDQLLPDVFAGLIRPMVSLGSLDRCFRWAH